VEWSRAVFSTEADSCPEPYRDATLPEMRSQCLGRINDERNVIDTSLRGAGDKMS
jgi:hypothetical protein